MRLLICAQALDERDPELGFFYQWVSSLAPHYDHVRVMCLRASTHTPHNVTTHVLSKTRVARALDALWYAVAMRKEYDAVFVHMNQEYILLLGWLWKLLGKKIYFWRNHYAGSLATRIAGKFATHVFYTSDYSYTARFPNAVGMPVGIDLSHFNRLSSITRQPNSILFVGRLAPSKRPAVLIEALSFLTTHNFSASFYGPPPAHDRSYVDQLQKKVAESKLDEHVHIHGAIPHENVPELFNRHAIFVNCSASGMYDKTIFEAAACECVVVASSKDFAKLVSPDFVFKDNDAQDLARTLERLLTLSPEDMQAAGKRMRAVAEPMSLDALIKALVQTIQP